MEAVSLKPNKKLTDGFYEFINSHSPKEVSRHLRCILLDYMSWQIKTGFPLDFNKYLWELADLFDLLDSAADYVDKKDTTLKNS
ncbi:MAG: hypothetical protein QM764_04645 [Chitinophagaceae bacterium]